MAVAKRAKKSQTQAETQLQQAYEMIMRLVPLSVPAPEYRDNLEQPDSRPSVQTITTYGSLYELV
jgi:outer membrane protein TolC